MAAADRQPRRLLQPNPALRERRVSGRGRLADRPGDSSPPRPWDWSRRSVAKPRSAKNGRRRSGGPGPDSAALRSISIRLVRNCSEAKVSCAPLRTLSSKPSTSILIWFGRGQLRSPCRRSSSLSAMIDTGPLSAPSSVMLCPAAPPKVGLRKAPRRSDSATGISVALRFEPVQADIAAELAIILVMRLEGDHLCRRGRARSGYSRRHWRRCRTAPRRAESPS